ncbi:hypothetical protein [Chroococcidiopsis sp. CCMEE 29]|uniref:hypothetical protein n=1 Tax=Chroococcidiopsis sp. CCMEE 29 TaxID=155894 RepID=UPI0020210316|nr:hypothetical protein [Chroococcidiopsis sp. CCMEE 29]
MTVKSRPQPLPLSQAWERGAGGGVRAANHGQSTGFDISSRDLKAVREYVLRRL